MAYLNFDPLSKKKLQSNSKPKPISGQRRQQLSHLLAPSEGPKHPAPDAQADARRDAGSDRGLLPLGRRPRFVLFSPIPQSPSDLGVLTLTPPPPPCSGETAPPAALPLQTSTSCCCCTEGRRPLQPCSLLLRLKVCSNLSILIFILYDT